MPDFVPSTEMALNDRFRATLLRATRSDSLLQDQIDSAMLAIACGYQDEARALLALVFLQQGFSPELRTSHVALVKRVGLWPSAIIPEIKPSPIAGFPITLAIEELRGIMRDNSASDALLFLPPGSIILPELRRTFTESPPSVKEALLDQARDVTGRLSAIPPFISGHDFASLIGGDAQTLSLLQPIAVEEFLAESVSVLTKVFILEIYRRFVTRILPLLALWGHEGLAVTASLSTTALGPYFTNVSFLLRDVRDLFALVEAAAEQPPSQTFIERWTLLLSLHLRRDHMLDLLDEYGDRGMIRALSCLLQRLAASDPIDPPKDLVWKIRDAFLDIGEMELGGKAQELIAIWSPNDPLEWELLSDIRSSGGDASGAWDALAYVLKLDVARPSALARVTILESGKKAQIFGGFNSAARRPLRLSRLALFRSMG